MIQTSLYYFEGTIWMIQSLDLTLLVLHLHQFIRVCTVCTCPSWFGLSVGGVGLIYHGIYGWFMLTKLAGPPKFWLRVAHFWSESWSAHARNAIKLGPKTVIVFFRRTLLKKNLWKDVESPMMLRIRVLIMAPCYPCERSKHKQHRQLIQMLTFTFLGRTLSISLFSWL